MPMGLTKKGNVDSRVGSLFNSQWSGRYARSANCIHSVGRNNCTHCVEGYVLQDSGNRDYVDWTNLVCVPRGDSNNCQVVGRDGRCKQCDWDAGFVGNKEGG